MLPFLLVSALTISHASARAYPRLGYSMLESRQSSDNVSFGTPSVTAANPYDHTWIEAYTALGDSYSVGLGAGHAVAAAKGLELNTDCYQYTYGYPNILNEDGMIGVNPDRNFQYFGCSGALVPAIKSNQVPKMQKSQLVTLSAGGNDAHLATILNYCIYQWATGWFWTCDGEIRSANNTINSDGYTNDMKDLMSAITPNLDGSTARIYWVGYERFWDTTTNQCDSVTWSFTRNYGFRQYLTQDRRNKMNSLVDNVNAKIKAVCSSTPQCIYVDPTDDINSLKGHFCEPDVDESYHWPGGGVSANREQTWFYEWGTTKDNDSDDDKQVNQPEKRDDPTTVTPSTTLANDTTDNDLSFEGAIAYYIQQGQQNNTLNTTALGTYPSDYDFNVQGSLLPDSYGRVFHLDKYANGDVALRILNAMDAEQASQMGSPATTITISVCGVTAVPTPVSAGTPPIASGTGGAPTPVSAGTPPSATGTGGAPTPCQGNQVEGSCTQAHIPSSTPDSGAQPPVCNKVDADGTEYVRVNAEKAEQAAGTYCANLISAGTVIDAQNTAPKAGTVSGAAEKGGELALNVLFDVDSCDQGTAEADQKVDFKVMGQDLCVQNLYQTLAQFCAQDSTWGDYDPDYTLEGGTYAGSCALWGMAGLTGTATS